MANCCICSICRTFLCNTDEIIGCSKETLMQQIFVLYESNKYVAKIQKNFIEQEFETDILPVCKRCNSYNEKNICKKAKKTPHPVSAVINYVSSGGGEKIKEKRSVGPIIRALAKTYTTKQGTCLFYFSLLSQLLILFFFSGTHTHTYRIHAAKWFGDVWFWYFKNGDTMGARWKNQSVAMPTVRLGVCRELLA